jgi:hypothetical protein
LHASGQVKTSADVHQFVREGGERIFRPRQGQACNVCESNQSELLDPIKGQQGSDFSKPHQPKILNVDFERL